MHTVKDEHTIENMQLLGHCGRVDFCWGWYCIKTNPSILREVLTACVG